MDIDVKKAIAELDLILNKKGSNYTLFICGGASLIFLGYDGRRTGDVDIIEQEIDEILSDASTAVSKKLKIPTDWLNNKVTPLGDRLGKNWKSKSVELFKGHALTLMSISRQDLINSKLHAAVDRKAKDYKDLIWLKPTLKELKAAEVYALRQSKTETYGVFVSAYIQELMNDLGL